MNRGGGTLTDTGVPPYPILGTRRRRELHGGTTLPDFRDEAAAGIMGGGAFRRTPPFFLPPRDFFLDFSPKSKKFARRYAPKLHVFKYVNSFNIMQQGIDLIPY